MFYKNIHTKSPVSSRCLNFFADIVGRIKCPAYIGCGDTPTRNTNPVILTELEMSICCFFCCFFVLLLLLFVVVVFFVFLCVCVYRHFSWILKRVFQLLLCVLKYISYSFCVCVFSYWLFCRKD